MTLHITTLVEGAPGDAWAAHFREKWPAFSAWFLSQGELKRPTFLATRRALSVHMSELLPLYDQLVALAGGSDHAARALGLYCPAPFISGCSQAVWLRDEPFIVRNYDYASAAWEHKLVSTCWLGRHVMGMSDCLWGLLDGVNEAGLAVSLAFGGRKVEGDGFGIPLILRYVLEVCSTTAEAVAVLLRVPCNMAYNITVLDERGAHATVFVGPDRPHLVTQRQVITNHQGAVEWVAHAEATGSVDRLRVLSRYLDSPTETGDRFITRFLEPPTYSIHHRRGFGTLYTAVYRPLSRSAIFLWPGSRWDQSLAAFRPAAVAVEVSGL